MLDFYVKYNNKTYKDYMNGMCKLAADLHQQKSLRFRDVYRMVRYGIDDRMLSFLNKLISPYFGCRICNYPENTPILDGTVTIKDVIDDENRLGDYFRGNTRGDFSIYKINYIYVSRGLRNLRNLRKKYRLMWRLIGARDVLLHIYSYITDTRGYRHYNIMMNSLE